MIRTHKRLLVFTAIAGFNIIVAAGSLEDVELSMRQAACKVGIDKFETTLDVAGRHHSLEFLVYNGYNAIKEFEKTKDPAMLERAKANIMGLVDVFVERQGREPKTALVFFAREKFFKSFAFLRDTGALHEDDLERMNICVGLMDMTAERAGNNRAANYAIGNILAARTLPEHPNRKIWMAYANAVWDDWYIPGDSYEPGYVAHNLPRLIELGSLLNKEDEIQSHRIRKTMYRYRDQISPSGLVVTPGDGEPYAQPSYVPGLLPAYEMTKDPTLLWAIKKAWMAGDKSTGRRSEEDFYQEFPQYENAPVVMPETKSAVQNLFPDTYKLPDRMILCPGRESGNPFAMFWIQDDCNYLYHGGVSDTRGDLTHYEADGVLLIADRGRYDWPAWNNTLIVSEPDAEYPFRRTSGVHAGRWYRGSANLRVMRAYLPSEDYSPHPEVGFVDKKKPYGYLLGNPNGLSGQNDKHTLKEIELQFALLPPGGENESGKVFPNRTWWGGYEYRNVCPSSVDVDIDLDRLAVAGPEGEKTILCFDELRDDMEFYFIAPDNARKFPQVPLSKKFYNVVTDPETGKKVTRITTRFGRTVLRAQVNQNVDLTEQYNRLVLYYKYVTPIKNWTRTPIAVGVNGVVRQDMLFDRQQGGILTSAKTEDVNSDSYGEVAYHAIWTHDSKWKRRVVLTKEGILVVRDEFIPGKTADGMIAGPVWHLPSAPKSGVFDQRRNNVTANWFDANLAHSPPEVRAFTANYGEDKTNLLIAFGDSPGQINGQQYQPKHWDADDYAVFSRRVLRANMPEIFVSVLIPHSSEISPENIAQNGRHGGLTITNKDGNTIVNLKVNHKLWKHKPMQIEINADGKWQVTRN